MLVLEGLSVAHIKWVEKYSHNGDQKETNRIGENYIWGLDDIEEQQ